MLGAQRVLADSMDKQVEKRAEYAQIARALCDVIRLKRDMRGVPDPKPVDVSQTKRRRKPDSGWIDPSSQPPGPTK